MRKIINKILTSTVLLASIATSANANASGDFNSYIYYYADQDSKYQPTEQFNPVRTANESFKNLRYHTGVLKALGPIRVKYATSMSVTPDEKHLYVVFSNTDDQEQDGGQVWKFNVDWDDKDNDSYPLT